MLVEVPELFLKNPKTLQLKNLTMLYYFNREVSQPIEVKINQHLLLHIFHGTKVIEKEASCYRVHAKESLFISRGQYIISEILSFDNASFDGIMIFFDDTFLISFFSKYASVFEGEKNSTELPLNNLVLVEKASALHETMVAMNAYVNQENCSEVLLQLKFEEILLQALQNDVTKQLYHYLRHLYSHGLQNFKTLFDTQEFADVEHMIKASKLSEEKFRTSFFEVYKATPKEWLIEKSLLKAERLLKEGTYNVSEVSQLCGCSSLSWFIKQFKSKFGETPKQFQQNYQKSQQNR